MSQHIRRTGLRKALRVSRAVLAEAIMQQMLEAAGEDLDVSVVSASVGPAPAGDT